MLALRLAALLLLTACSAATQGGMGGADSVDVLIKGGTVVDGTGSAGRRTDVGVRGNHIVFVGDAGSTKARRTIDATGLIVAPGFIDPHTHTQEDLSANRTNLNADYLMQGVTTVINGNDGRSALDVGRQLRQWDSAGIGTNAAMLVGHGTVRGAVLGMSDAAPNATQLDSMRAIVRNAMRGGALGMSTGLYYAPGSYAKTEEVIALAKEASAQSGVYDSHMRDESSYTIGVIGSINETIRIGREAHIPVHISHIKALGTDVWGQSDSIVKLVRAARASGLDVTADQYPYLASGSSIGASLLPRWAEAGGRDSLRARIADPATRARLVIDMTNNLRRRGGAASLLITNSSQTELIGKTLEQHAQAWNVSPIEAAIRIIQGGDAGVASFNMNEKDVVTFMKEPWVATGSDGSSGHPRKFGTFPRKYHEYVVTQHVLTLPEFVQRSSALTAETFHLPQRGRIATGWIADIAIFDPVTFQDRATYEKPDLLATGMRFVLVNGQVAVADGALTNVLAGRALRRGTP